MPRGFNIPPALLASDRLLLDELFARNAQNTGFYSEATGLQFANHELADMAQAGYDEQDVSRLEQYLEGKGTFDIPLIEGLTIRVDGRDQPVSVVSATETGADGANHGEMSRMLYLRDHVQVAQMFMRLFMQDPKRYAKEGSVARTLIMSGLHAMSSERQLARFKDVISRGPAAGQEDWPHISLFFDDMNTNQPNGWRNKQDSFQMLACTVFEALDCHFLDVSDLAAGHKQFLGSIVPFLAAVGYPEYESAGSWEEMSVSRTSVMAVETALLHKMRHLDRQGRVDFLQEAFLRHQDASPPLRGHDYGSVADDMLQRGLRAIGIRLPDESPGYPRHTIQYRSADATLAYVLMYNLPQLLAESQIRIGRSSQIMTAREIEELVLSQLDTLFDPKTNAYKRYDQDSYQRVNFHTQAGQWVVRKIKALISDEAKLTGLPVDLNRKQTLRGDLMPQGREAAWPHPSAQLAAWAAQRSMQSSQLHDLAATNEYRALGVQFLNRALSTVTGKNQWNAVLDANQQYRVRRVRSFAMAECLITYNNEAGEQIVVPSPHTPLHWGAAALKYSVGMMKICASQER